MAWKNQGGNNFNLNIDNFTAQSGIWNYSNGKLYHKNLRFGTSVGLGTDKPFSRLSFGNHEALRESNINLFKNPLIALSERIDGKKGTGIGFYYSNTDNYGIKFMCGGPNTLIFTEANNVKLYITNNGRFLFNKLKTDFNTDLAEVSINGSIGITGSITLGENLVNSPNVGTIRYTRGTTDVDKGKLLIKLFDNVNNDESNWYEIVTQDTKTKINIWQTQDNHLYYGNSVDIGHQNTKTNNSFSVKGNVMIGDSEFVSKNILGGKNRDGVVMIKNHLNINTNPQEVDYDTDVLMQLNIRDNNLNYILGGEFSDLDGHNSLFLCKGKTGDKSKLNGNFSIGFGENLKIFKSNYSFVMGNGNTVGNSTVSSLERADSNFIFGSNNILRGNENVLFSDSSDIISKNLMVMGTSNKIYREGSISNYNLVLGSENKMYDGTVLSEKKLSKSSSNIFGNLNQILTNTSSSPTAVGESFIVGDSNKINNIENNQESFIFGSNNTVSSSSHIFGDSNTNNDSKSQSKPTYIFGNYIDNSDPFTHAGYYTHNKIDLKSSATKPTQPSLIFVVGDAKDDGTFEQATGSMSVDAAGSIRCTNIYSNTPGAGLIRCNTIDFKNIKIDGEDVEIPSDYTVSHRINLSPNTLTGKKLIPLPIKGKILSIQSTLNMPNLNYNLSNVATINPITMDLFDKDGNKLQTITHNVNTIQYTNDNFLQALGDTTANGKTWDDVDYSENISKYNKTDNVIRENYLYIDITASQTGYGVSELEVYTTIQIIIKKSK